MNRYRKPRNPVLQLEVARAFAKLTVPDFSHVQDWALVQAFAPLFKTRRLARYWLHDMQRLIDFELVTSGQTGQAVTISQGTPDFYHNRTVLLLKQGNCRVIVLFSLPDPLTLEDRPVFQLATCPIELYLPQTWMKNRKDP